VLFPLLTGCQKDDLSHFYFTCLKRTLHVPYWNDIILSSIFCEKSFDNRCHSYWKRYRQALLNSIDGSLPVEQFSYNIFMSLWLDRKYRLKHIRRSKRILHHHSTTENCFSWFNRTEQNSIPHLQARFAMEI
jgi:hypothetical protein